MSWEERIFWQRSFFIWGLAILVEISRHDGKTQQDTGNSSEHAYAISCHYICKESAVTLPLVFVAYLYC